MCVLYRDIFQKFHRNPSTIAKLLVWNFDTLIRYFSSCKQRRSRQKISSWTAKCIVFFLWTYRRRKNNTAHHGIHTELPSTLIYIYIKQAKCKASWFLLCNIIKSEDMQFTNWLQLTIFKSISVSILTILFASSLTKLSKTFREPPYSHTIHTYLHT